MTAALVDSRDEIKWNIDAVDALIRSQLINLFEYDKFLATCLEGNLYLNIRFPSNPNRILTI